MKNYVIHHDHKISFFIVYLLVGLVMAMLFNLSILLLFVAVHFMLDYGKYRFSNHTATLSLFKSFQDQLMDLMFISISITLAVYLNRKTPGVVGLYSISALEEVGAFSIVRSIPRFALIEHTFKGLVHSLKHVRDHATHLKIPKFGDWEIFYTQVIIYCSILILIAPAVTALTYQDVVHNILVEVSPWRIGVE